MSNTKEYMDKYYREVLGPKRKKEREPQKLANQEKIKQKREYTLVQLCEQFPDVDISKYKNPLGSLKYMAKRDDLEWRKETLLSSIKSRAKRNNLEYNLDKDKMYWPQVCPVFGTPLDYNARIENRNNAPSVDRIDPNKGYTLENTAVISHKANQLKSNATLDQMIKITEYILKVST